MSRPLLIFDTNVLMDLLLGRDGAHADLLVSLAEAQIVDLVVPEYVVLEFRGTALRGIGTDRARLAEVRKVAAEWARSSALGEPADQIRAATATAEATLDTMRGAVDDVVARLKRAATVPNHTLDVHFRGDLGFGERALVV